MPQSTVYKMDNENYFKAIPTDKLKSIKLPVEVIMNKKGCSLECGLLIFCMKHPLFLSRIAQISYNFSQSFIQPYVEYHHVKYIIEVREHNSNFIHVK
jgi:hypothetical protein